jgi:hypothetical protein
MAALGLLLREVKEPARDPAAANAASPRPASRWVRALMRGGHARAQTSASFAPPRLEDLPGGPRPLPTQPDRETIRAALERAVPEGVE